MCKLHLRGGVCGRLAHVHVHRPATKLCLIQVENVCAGGLEASKRTLERGAELVVINADGAKGDALGLEAGAVELADKLCRCSRGGAAAS